MIRITLLFLVLAAAFSCTRGIDLRYVDLGSTFHDNNSKVWIVNKLIMNDINIAPLQDNQKDVMIFHKSGIINVLPLRKIGHEAARRGKFYLDSQKKTVLFEFEDKEKWEVKIQYVTGDSIFLLRTNDKDGPIGIQLMPFPLL